MSKVRALVPRVSDGGGMADVRQMRSEAEVREFTCSENRQPLGAAAMIVKEPRLSFLVYLWRRTWAGYWPMRWRGRVRGALRVLLGKSASIQRGYHYTALGPMRVTDYYGGCILSTSRGDIYWGVDNLDGWGGGQGQDLFERVEREL